MQTIRATILEQTTFPITSINLIIQGAKKKFTAHYKYITELNKFLNSPQIKSV